LNDAAMKSSGFAPKRPGYSPAGVSLRASNMSMSAATCLRKPMQFHRRCCDPLEREIAERLEQFAAAGVIVFTSRATMFADHRPGSVMRQQRYHGSLVARIDGGDLLMNGVAPEIIERYRLALTVDDQVMATTAASFADGAPAHYATTISPLPANIHLKAAGYATAAPLAEIAPIWASWVLR